MTKKKIDLGKVLTQAKEDGLPIATSPTDFCENPRRIYLSQGNPEWAILEKQFQKNLEKATGGDWLVERRGKT